jgi:hypothetical protein
VPRCRRVDRRLHRRPAPARCRARVYALDVGRGQLAASLRPIHACLDGADERPDLTAATLPEPIDLATIDVSFISLALVLGPVATTLARGGAIVALVKPQFEAGKGRTDHGVVRDPAIHREVLERVVAARGRAASGTGGHRLADPRPGGQPRVPVHLAPGPGCAEIDERIAEVTGP